uniref:Uncharacterized protein n=1 Tax=uncultured prokaryote TaxID=198431 RepID=A0A0H5QLN9_9ZZZZ|nr:hypothetical protein [uncultured prokaryote]
MRTRNDFTVSPATLDRYAITRNILRTADGPVIELTIVGSCHRRRKPLWNATEVVDSRREPCKAADIVLHWSMVCEQDSPTTQAEFDRGVMGETWDQARLW